jgi:ubiquinone/menaquinone biosynthesis C-methylase UbiE
MEGQRAANLRIWSGWARNSVRELTVPVNAVPRAFLPESSASQYYAAETMHARGQRNLPSADPYSLQWFLNIETLRHGRQGKWIPRLLEFAKHSGETMLGVGNGLGTDWAQYARHGAAVVACSSSPEHLELTRRNFEVRGLNARFFHCTPSCLPLDNSSIDVVCVSSFLHEHGDPDAVVREIYRVLKPGGKVVGVIPASYDVDFWFGLCFPWTRLFGKRRAQLGTAGQKYSRRRLKRLFQGFIEHRIHQRHLSRGDIPHIWRWAPRPMMERMMGRVLVLKAFKPVSAAIAMPIAA